MDTRRLDVLVAEHVFGDEIGYDGDGEPGTVLHFPDGTAGLNFIPHYLTSLNAAFEVIATVGGGIRFNKEDDDWGVWVGVPNRGMEFERASTWQAAWRRCVVAYLRSKGVALDPTD